MNSSLTVYRVRKNLSIDHPVGHVENVSGQAPCWLLIWMKDSLPSHPKAHEHHQHYHHKVHHVNHLKKKKRKSISTVNLCNMSLDVFFLPVICVCQSEVLVVLTIFPIIITQGPRYLLTPKMSRTRMYQKMMSIQQMTLPQPIYGSGCSRNMRARRKVEMAARSVMFQYSSIHTLIFCFSFPGSDIRIYTPRFQGHAECTLILKSDQYLIELIKFVTCRTFSVPRVRMYAITVHS